MASKPISALKPRKTPRQARSEATVDAIFEATIQVLLTEGAARLTTTRISERAGVSVGTMYQYFPNKQSLLLAVSKRHMEEVLAALQAACDASHGMTAERIVQSMVGAYIEAKTADTETSVALYSVLTDLNVPDLVGKFTARLTKLMEATLESACDIEFADVPLVTNMLRTAMTGVTRAVFEQNAPRALIRKWHMELLAMCQAYVRSVGVERKDKPVEKLPSQLPRQRAA